MRRTLQVVGVLGLAFAWAITIAALYGPHRLPLRIPVHFDAAGRVNGWGAPGTLWLMPIVATVVYALMAWVTRYPSAFNYPVRVTPATRPRLQALTITMIACLQAEVVCLFAWIQWATVESARRGRSALAPWSILAAILVIWITIGWYVVAMIRISRRAPRA